MSVGASTATVSPESVISGVDVTKLVAHHSDPLAALADLRAVRAETEVLVKLYVNRARRAGASWTELGYHLGVSAQAVQKRYGAKSPASRPAKS